MKHIILIQAESQMLGAYSNLKAFWDLIENQKQHYATVSMYLRHKKTYDAGTVIIAGKLYAGVTIQKVPVNLPLI